MADAPPAIPEITEEELAKRKKKIEDAFALFDKEGKGCLIQEEVSTVMRYLGAFPREPFPNFIKAIIKLHQKLGKLQAGPQPWLHVVIF